MLNNRHISGNHKINFFTKSRPHEIRFELGGSNYAKYGTFSINSELDNYRLNVAEYQGNAGVSISLYFIAWLPSWILESLNSSMDMYLPRWWFYNWEWDDVLHKWSRQWPQWIPVLCHGLPRRMVVWQLCTGKSEWEVCSVLPRTECVLESLEWTTIFAFHWDENQTNLIKGHLCYKVVN